jgi:hypothetical protein
MKLTTKKLMVIVFVCALCVTGLLTGCHAEEGNGSDVLAKIETCRIASEIGGIVMEGKSIGVDFQDAIHACNVAFGQSAKGELCKVLTIRVHQFNEYDGKKPEDAQADIFNECLGVLEAGEDTHTVTL